VKKTKLPFDNFLSQRWYKRCSTRFFWFVYSKTKRPCNTTNETRSM